MSDRDAVEARLADAIETRLGVRNISRHEAETCAELALSAALASPELPALLADSGLLVHWGGIDQDGHTADLEDIKSDEQYRASFYAEFGKLEPEPVWEPLFCWLPVSPEPREKEGE